MNYQLVMAIWHDSPWAYSSNPFWTFYTPIVAIRDMWATISEQLQELTPPNQVLLEWAAKSPPPEWYEWYEEEEQELFK